MTIVKGCVSCRYCRKQQQQQQPARPPTTMTGKHLRALRAFVATIPTRFNCVLLHGIPPFFAIVQHCKRNILNGALKLHRHAISLDLLGDHQPPKLRTEHNAPTPSNIVHDKFLTNGRNEWRTNVVWVAEVSPSVLSYTA